MLNVRIQHNADLNKSGSEERKVYDHHWNRVAGGMTTTTLRVRDIARAVMETAAAEHDEKLIAIDHGSNRNRI